MSVVQTSQPTDFVRPLQGPWVRRNLTELPQTNFRTALRGFDRDEVRTVLEDVAAAYRVLQMQNASLRRQLANLEAVLVAYRREDSPFTGGALEVRQQRDHVLQRANDEAQAILSRAHARAEEMMARACARVRAVERHVEQLEEGQKRFRTVLGATISDLLTVLTMTRRDRDGDGSRHQDLANEMLVEAPISHPALTGELTQPVPSNVRSASAMYKDTGRADETESDANDRGPLGTPPAAVTYVGFTARNARNRNFAAAESPSETVDTVEQIETMLKGIDVALVEIPALPCE